MDISARKQNEIKKAFYSHRHSMLSSDIAEQLQN